MFCPQCRADYREGFTRCAVCDVDLVPDCPAVAREEDLWAAPTVVVWEGHDAAEAAKTREHIDWAGIPGEVTHDAERGVHQVKVFPATERIAREVLLVPREEFEPPLTLDELEKRTGVCPLCGLDFYWKQRICGRCLAPLIAPEEEESNLSRRAAAVHHPGDARLIFNKLRYAGIPFFMNGMNIGIGDIIVPRAPLESGKYSFSVLENDLEAAETVVRTVPLHDLPFEAAPSHTDDELQMRDADLADHATVWQGTDQELGEALRYALRETGIDSVLEDSNGALRLLVPPEDAERSKPIVKQVAEGISLEEFAALDEDGRVDQEESR